MLSAPVAVIWTLLSVLVAMTCTFSLLQPTWYLRQTRLPYRTKVDEFMFGMFSYCYLDYSDEYVCSMYGGGFTLDHFPSASWQVACVMYGGGCVLLCLCAVAAVISLCLPPSLDKSVALCSGYTQIIAGRSDSWLEMVNHQASFCFLSSTGICFIGSESLI